MQYPGVFSISMVACVCGCSFKFALLPTEGIPYAPMENLVVNTC